MKSLRTIHIAIALLLVFPAVTPVRGQSPGLLRSTLSIGGPPKANHTAQNDFSIQHSVGQSSVIGTLQHGHISLRQGLLQPVRPRMVEGFDGVSALKAKIYPNPFSSGLSVSIDGSVDDPVIIQVHDLMGRMLYTKTFEPATQIGIGFNSVPSALYVIQVHSGARMYVARIRKIDP